VLVSRSFGRPITDAHELSEAIAAHAARAAEKLREDGMLASSIVVFIRTNQHRIDQEQYRGDELEPLDPPTDDARAICGAAARALARVRRDGYMYKRAGVMLQGLTPADVVQPSLPGMGGEIDPNKDRLMKAVDALNHKLGRDAVRLASTGFEREWKGKAELQSGASLSDPANLPKAKDGPKPRIRFHE
jgi:DNA polymerase V